MDLTGPTPNALQPRWAFRRSEHTAGPPSHQRNRSVTASDEGSDVVRGGLKLVGVFETERQARFAAAWLKCLSHLDILGTRIIAPRSIGMKDANPVRGVLPDASWRQIRDSLSENHVMLIVTIDECDSHETRAVLDEDVGSLTTMVFPQSATGTF